MVKAWQDRQHRGAQALGGRTAVVSKEKFTVSWGAMIDAAILKDTLDKLAQQVVMWHVYGTANAVKAMKDMV